MNRTMVAMWSSEGLECVIDFTEMAQQDLLDTLKSGHAVKSQTDHYLNMMIWRARANSHRHCEIYLFNAVEGISADDVRGMFEDDPQMAADTIRRIGTEMYSDRYAENKAVIR